MSSADIFVPLPALAESPHLETVLRTLADGAWNVVEIPTQVVLQPGEPAPTPTQVRVYLADMYLHRGKILTSRQLAKTKGFRGTSYATSLVMAEVILDEGSDGRTDYRVVGYRFQTGVPTRWKDLLATDAEYGALRRAWAK